MQGLAEGLADRGHEVTVLTTAPAYRVRHADARAEGPESRHEGRLSIVRARTLPMHKVAYLLRGLGILFAPLQMWRALRRHVSSKFDAAFIYSPPVTLGSLGALLRREGMRVVLGVQDIFPQNAIDL